ncbi:hypothetical protein OIU78_013915 [Salix suchowensis]|nr:hypothetical protein OIU78_013915 [Salix suchowensis]KAJ6326922.1 hypothetical protein OIU78_013915 [Salix suchowensis]
MAFTSFSSMSIKSPNISTASSKSPHHVLSLSKPFRIAYQLDTERGNQLADCSKNGYEMETAKSKNWARVVSTTLAAAVISFSSCNLPAVADLNKFEAEIRGEFGIGSAAQFGSADLRKAVHLNENFRRANFTAADMRESDFSGSTFNGAYMEKAVAYKANFTGKTSCSTTS